MLSTFLQIRHPINKYDLNLMREVILHFRNDACVRNICREKLMSLLLNDATRARLEEGSLEDIMADFE